MKVLRVLIVAALIFSFVGAAAATVLHAGAESSENTQTVSLRQESEHAPHGVYFLSSHGGRSHMGGGMHGGK
jgi:hypothetical protein